MTPRIVLTTLFLIFSGIACDRTTSQSSETSTRGVTASWGVELQARIGSLDDPEQSLTDVPQVVIGPGDRIYISQPMESSIRVYDSRGFFLTTIGGSGEGPGEFAALGQIGFVGDTLYALDPGSGRLNRFLPDGTYLTSTTWRPDLVRGPPGVVFAPSVPQDFVLLSDRASLVKPGMSVLPNAQLGTVRIPVLRVDPQSQITDTVAWEQLSGSGVDLNSGGEVFRIRNPFVDGPLFDLMPDGSGVVIVHRPSATTSAESTFRVSLISPTRDTVFSSAFPYTPVPTSTEVVRRLIERVPIFPADRPNAPGIGEIEEALRGERLIPATSIPVTGLAVGQDGTVWLRREHPTGDSVFWNIINQEGRLVGRVSLPEGQTVVVAQTGVFAALETDELDVPYVLVYRVLHRESLE